MLHQPEAGPELIACLEDRRDDGAEALKQAPIWQAAMVLLGRLGDRGAVPALTTVLQDSDASLDVLIAAIRALGRIGDANAAPAVEQTLTRDDLPTVRELQVSSAAGTGVRDDARWQIELAAAEALAKMGAPRPELVAKHKDDERAYVRRYAAKVEQAG